MEFVAAPHALAGAWRSCLLVVPNGVFCALGLPCPTLTCRPPHPPRRYIVCGKNKNVKATCANDARGNVGFGNAGKNVSWEWGGWQGPWPCPGPL